MTDKTTRLLRSMKKQERRFESKTPITQEMFIPNYSGLKSGSERLILRNLHLGDPTEATFSHELDVHGHVEIEHTADETFDHAFEVHLDAAAFGGTNAMVAFYDTGAIAGGKDESVNLVSIDQSDATGGDVSGYKVLSTGGSASITGLSVGAQIAPISQQSGSFGDMDTALVKTTNRLTEFTNAGNDIAMFVADNDTVQVGDASKFVEIEWLFATTASGAGIKPKFEFSTGVDAWTEFFPTDGTGGMHNNGVIAWELDDIGAWAVGTSSKFLIRITRQRNNLTTVPIESKVQIVSSSEFSWNKAGDIVANSITANLIPSAEMDAGAHTIGFTQQSQTGDGTTTIDWKLGNKDFHTFGSQNETFTFTAPTNPCNILLVLKQDSTGSRTVTWPSSVKWPGGTAPTLTTGANSIDIIAFYFDGTSYYGVDSLNFS